jgi:hypothetical protein
VTRHLSPAAIAVVGAFALAFFILLLGGSIAGSYLLTIHYVQAQQALAVKSSVPLCQALRDTTSLHHVYLVSQCPQILARFHLPH